MPDAVPVTKAQLVELKPDGSDGIKVPVQFNPESLKVSFSNQIVPPEKPAGAVDQRSTSGTQYVGKGTTKLSVQLWFDVTSLLPQGEDAAVDDVRQVTKKVAYFITPKAAADDKNKFLPPGVSFRWGTFKFDGIVESMEESLELFSPDGKPLRAGIALSISQQSIQFAFTTPGQRAGAPVGMGGGAPPGTQPLSTATAGDTLQGMADRIGKGADWQEIAAANNIENPRQLQPGQMIDLNI